MTTLSIAETPKQEPNVKFWLENDGDSIELKIQFDNNLGQILLSIDNEGGVSPYKLDEPSLIKFFGTNKPMSDLAKDS